MIEQRPSIAEISQYAYSLHPTNPLILAQACCTLIQSPNSKPGGNADAESTTDIVYGIPAKAFDFILPDIAFIENIQIILSQAASGGPVLFEVTGIDEGKRVG